MKRPWFTVQRFRSVVMTLVLLVASFSLSAAPAHAQWATIGTTILDIPRTIWNIAKKVDDKILKALEISAQIAYEHAVTYFLQKVAYESAVYLTSGGPGQTVQFWRVPVGRYLEQAGDEAVGDFLNRMSRELWGQSICEPITPTIKLQLTLLAKRSQEPIRPQCTWSRIRQKYGFGSYDQVRLDQLSLTDVISFRAYFKPEENDLGTITRLQGVLNFSRTQNKEVAKLFREINKEIKPELEKITLDIKTPSWVSKNFITQAFDKAAGYIPSYYGGATQRALSAALRTFTNTFASRLLTRIRDGFATSGGTDGLGPRGPQEFITGNSGVRAAQQTFKYFEEPVFGFGGSVDVTSNLTSCPSDRTARRWYNCRLKPEMKEAIDRGITLKQALELDPQLDGTLGFDGVSGTAPDWDQGFPYATLVILRSYRIIPVGWELAATYIEDILPQYAVTNNDVHGGKQRWTLKEVMDCFEYDNPSDPENVLKKADNRYPENCRINPDDANSINPFYHLVDPDWVLKSFDTRCLAEGPGAELAEPPRLVEQVFQNADGTLETRTEWVVSRPDEYCADTVTCLDVDPTTGRCASYGYCVEEQATWNFSATQCPAAYNTCQTFTANDQSVAVLTNTLESCDSNDAGCRWYSTYRQSSGIWEGNTDLNGNGSADRLYFNGQTLACPSGAAGCTLFYDLGGFVDAAATVESIVGQVTGSATAQYSDYASQVTPTYLKQAPEYLNCPYNLLDPNRDPECDQYAQVCTPEDVGCQFYTPANGDPAVAAKVDLAVDQCVDASCVGFATFTEVASYFDDVKDGVIDGVGPGGAVTVNFVPGDPAQSCQQAGCEMFINKDSVDQGGEGREYYTWLRSCVEPGVAGTATYYSWEGSEDTGFQLRRWTMLQGSGGAPCTEVDPANPTTCVAADSCTFGSGNPTCMRFFDDSGQIYEADIQSIVTSSEDCHPLERVTTGELYYGIPSQSGQCGASQVDCREYRGAGAYNVRTLFVNDFESDPTQGWVGATPSNESILLNGTSIAINDAQKAVGSLVRQNRYYTVSFLGKGGSVSFSLENPVTGEVTTIGSQSLGTEWGLYTLGPVELTHVPDAGEVLRMSGNGFIDFVVLKENEGSLLYIKDTWDSGLAAQCEANGDFGCQLYTGEIGGQLALRSFSGVCQEQYVGCKALVDTQNSVDPRGQVFNDGNNSTVIGQRQSYLDDITIPADEVVYIVDQPQYRCTEDVKGCQMVGDPIINRTIQEPSGFTDGACRGGDCMLDVVEAFNEIFVINNPDEYGELIDGVAIGGTLCQATNLYCSAFVGDTVEYYIDPGNATCFYQDGVWHKSDGSGMCDVNAQGQPITSDDERYTGFVGLCQPQYNTCSLIRDPEPSSGEIYEDYYVLYNTIEDDLAACNEESGLGLTVDRGAGCRLFADLSQFGEYAVTGQLDYDPLLSVDGQPPVSNADPALNTANVVMKVRPDRECGKFLHCVSELQSETGDDNLCIGIGLCSQADSEGNCIDPLARIVGANEGQQEMVIRNDQASSDPLFLNNINLARWRSGMSKVGAIWPQGYTTPGLYQYHQMKEVGSPVTLPNSNFEDENNFGGQYSSWPQTINGSIAQQNAQIVTRTSTVQPFEGQRMLRLALEPNPDDPTTVSPAFVTSAELPASNDLTMVLSFYVNFSGLLAEESSICTLGHEDMIGQECVSNADCLAGPTACSAFGDGAGYCKLPINGSYRECSSDNDCFTGSGLTFCSEFTCSVSNRPCTPSTTVNDCGSGEGVCRVAGNYTGGERCTEGDPSKIGQSCNSADDCAPTTGLCEPSGSILHAIITQANGTSVVEDVAVQKTNDHRGWYQVSIPFTVAGGEGSTFRVKLEAVNPGGTIPPQGSIAIDNLQLISGLQLSASQVVSPSCRLYPNTSDAEPQTDALSCDHVIESGLTGDALQVRRGWRGYCVEPVPNQGLQDYEAEVCLNWWPVDVIQSSSELIGADAGGPQFGSNLYYCAHSVGGGNTTKGSIGDPNQIDDVYLNTYMHPAPDAGVAWGRTGSGLPGLVQGDYHYFCEVEDTQEYAVLDDDIYDYEIASIYIEWGGEGDNHCRNGYPHSGSRVELKRIGDNKWELDQYPLWGGTGYIASAYLDPATRKLDHFEMKIISDQNLPGGGEFRFVVTTKDVCQTLIRAATTEGQHTAWSHRFLQGSSVLLYEEDQDATPYGAVAGPSNIFTPDNLNEDNPWLKSPIIAMMPDETYYCGSTASGPQSCARAGTPYSAQSVVGSGSCVLGSIARLSTENNNYCTTNSECVESEDSVLQTGLCVGMTPNLDDPTVLYAANPYLMDAGVYRLSSLFARSYDIYGWDYALGRYIKCDPANPAEMPLTCMVTLTSVNGNSNPEEISGSVSGAYRDGLSNDQGGAHAVLSNYDITGCGYDGFKNNGTFMCQGVDSTGKSPVVTDVLIEAQGQSASEGQITIASGQFVQLRFIARVNDDREPLKALKVDWGDGTPYQPNQDLSNLAGQGLAAGDYLFTHQYVCGDGAGSCTFTPRIQLKDNWGWCTGDFYGTDCNSSNGWYAFPGEVVVSGSQVSLAGGCTLNASPAVITPGSGASTLTWQVPAGSVPVALQKISGDTILTPDPVNFSQQSSAVVTAPASAASGSAVYQLTVQNSIGFTSSCRATVIVGPGSVSCTMTASPSNPSVGQQVTVNWTANNTDFLALSPDVAGVNPINTPPNSGSFTYIPTSAGSQTLTMLAEGLSGQSSCQTTVTVGQIAAQCDLNVSPGFIHTSQTATLSWTSIGATSAELSDGAGVTPVGVPNGSLAVGPDVNTNYILNVSGPGGGGSCSAILQVTSAQCQDGNSNLIGNPCLSTSQCERSADGICSFSPIADGYCKDSLEPCGPSSGGCGGGVCMTFVCAGGTNNGASCVPGNTLACPGGVCSTGSTIPNGTSGVCSAGLQSRLGQSCTSSANCNSAGSGVCAP